MGQPQNPAGPGSTLVLSFDRIDAGMLEEVGGKAANLGELTRAGLPVPDGFCLTTDAYRLATGSGQPEPGSGPRVTGEGELGAVIEALNRTDPADLPALSALAATARRAVFDAGMPAEVADALRDAYTGLGPDVPVAVRSSATAEDLPFASFAGQQDTYLNVVGADDVVTVVRRCWASLWTDRAVSYRTSNGIDHATVALAVVVQKMVDAEAAGVMFTANPVTGRRNEAVIDASPGLGEAVVSGAVNPDHFVVDGDTGRILERKLGDKKLVIRALPGGGTERIETGASASGHDPVVEPVETGTANGSTEPCLDDDRIRELAALGRRVEAHFGAPQDTEWAIDGAGTLWLTQSRPITTLYPLPSRSAPASGVRVYLCFSLAQGLTRPLTPMGITAIRLIGSSVAQAAGFKVSGPRRGPSPFAEAGQRIYFDLTTVLRSKTGREIVPRVFDIMEARSAAVMRRLFDDPRFAVVNKTPWRLFRHVAPIAVKHRVPETLLRAAFRPTAALARVERFGRRLEAALEVPGNATAHERLNHAERLLGRELFPILPNTLPPAILGFAMLGLVHRMLGGAAPFGELQDVLRGLPNNVTTEMDLELWDLGVAIRGDRASARAFADQGPAELAASYKEGLLPEVVQSGLDHFLERYGHRAVAEIDLGMPRWSDDPTHIIGVLANYLRLDDPSLAPDRQFRKAEEEAEARINELVARAGNAGGLTGRLRAKIVRGALDRTRRFAGLRELPKYSIVLGLAAARREIALAGEALAAAGRIADVDDVFFLDLDEARLGLDGMDLHALVALRREAYDQELKRRHIPRMLFSDGTEPEALHVRGPATEGALSGTPASAGTVSAVARVILDPVGARLEPGEILVAPCTDPGWTPLFLTAGGLVMEMGGANSHGAVVAREYGIPAVVGVPDATSLISTGQRITVDGAAGTVTLQAQ